MRRKNRKWVAAAVFLYLFVLWSAFRWSIHQRPSDGPLLEHIQREEVRKLNERKAREAAAQQLQPNGESRLNAAGPAYVAARYDRTHVVFMVAADTESRFSSSPLSRFAARPTRISAPDRPAAPLAGLQELYEPDSSSLHFFPKIVQQTPPGEQWTLSFSPDFTIPVVIERPVIAPMGCSLALGFLASIPPDQQSTFAASAREYFAVRRTPVESANPPVNSHIAELPDWKPSPAAARQIEQQLVDRMKKELAQIDARLVANAGTPGASAGEFPAGPSRRHLKEWMRADQALTHGEGKLDYDVRAFRLTPDGAPRLFVRARWTLADAPVFLMSAWFKAESRDTESSATQSPPAQPLNTASKTDTPVSDTQPLLLSVDSSWSTALRESDATGTLGERLDFQTILNEFDADHDGWAELLIHSYDAYSYEAGSPQPPSTVIALYLYTDFGLVPMKAPLRRGVQSPESCLDP